ncbi:hypothetical protein PEC301619_19920 [Pectobacterium carotovorum subsp. carotovorum]|nr:hypothetical protein PEC301619_19920 [Pectobacterium carotovorum subsp. carotovorum]
MLEGVSQLVIMKGGLEGFQQHDAQCRHRLR